MATKSRKEDARMMQFDKVIEDGSPNGGYDPTAHTPFKVGDKLFMRCQNYYYTGLVKAILLDWVILTQAAWIPDTGEFSDALETGEFLHVQPYPKGRDVSIPLSTIDDVSPFPLPLPGKKKSG